LNRPPQKIFCETPKTTTQSASIK